MIIWAKTASNPTFDDVDDVSMLFRARLISTALPTTAGTGRARLKNRIHRGAVVQRQLCLVATMDVKTLAGYALFTCGHMTIITIASQHNSWSCYVALGVFQMLWCLQLPNVRGSGVYLLLGLSFVFLRIGSSRWYPELLYLSDLCWD